MAEYIEREDAYNLLTEYYHHSTEVQHEALREAIERVPTADVQPVVRCKDCFANGLCSIQDAMMWSGNVTGWDYCSHGKRREDNG